MKVFLINLDKNPDRLAAADAQLKRLGVEYERFPAVYGKALSEEEIATLADDEWARRLNGRSLSRGEVGCALSHIQVYEKMVREGIPIALVLEDDAYPMPPLKPVLRAIEEQISGESSTVILLGEGGGRRDASRKRIFLPVSVYALDAIVTGARTHAYVVTLGAARRLATFLRPVVMPADDWGRMVAYGQIRMYTICPLLVGLDCGFETMISENWGQVAPKRTFVRKWIRRCWRLWWREHDNWRAWRARRQGVCAHDSL